MEIPAYWRSDAPVHEFNACPARGCCGCSPLFLVSVLSVTRRMWILAVAILRSDASIASVNHELGGISSRHRTTSQ